MPIRPPFALLILVATTAGCRTADSDSGPAHAVASISANPDASLASAPDALFTDAGVTLRYRDIGRGEPVVLVHGYTRSLEDWVGIADSLALDHRVIALDLRGFGQSTRFADPSHFGPPMADDIVRLLDHLGIAAAHLVGHSMGALIAADLAVRHPARVATASLIAGPFYADSATFNREVAPWIADLEQGRGLVTFLQWLFPEMPAEMAQGFNAMTLEQNDLGTLLAVMRSMGSLLPDGPSSVPALIAVGTGDPLHPLSRDLAAQWPNAELLELPGVDHLVIVGHPQVLAAMRALMGSGAAAEDRARPRQAA